MDGNKPAPWYLEDNGQKTGPYTSQEIMKLVMDGRLKLETRIFDSAADTWKMASEVVPYLDLDTPSENQEKVWQPPPKPTELRNTHIVNLNIEATGSIDYFVLISDRKRELEKERLSARAQTEREREEGPRARQSAPPQPQMNRSMLSAVRKAEKTQIIRVLPPLENKPTLTEPTIDLTPAKTPHPPVDKKALGPDENLNPAPATGFFDPIKELIQRNQKILSVAASLAFVFAGSYGVIRSMTSNHSSREPASATPAREELKAPVAEAKPTAAELDTIGTGQNKVQRASGTVTSATPPPMNIAKAIPAPNNPPPEANSTPSADNSREQHRDPPQFITTSDLPPDNNNPDPNAPITAAPPPAGPTEANNTMPGTPPGAVDPNADPVKPPGFLPPGPDATGQPPDPNRVPTNDPNYPNPNGLGQ